MAKYQELLQDSMDDPRSARGISAQNSNRDPDINYAAGLQEEETKPSLASVYVHEITQCIEGGNWNHQKLIEVIEKLRAENNYDHKTFTRILGKENRNLLIKTYGDGLLACQTGNFWDINKLVKFQTELQTQKRYHEEIFMLIMKHMDSILVGQLPSLLHELKVNPNKPLKVLIENRL